MEAAFIRKPKPKFKMKFDTFLGIPYYIVLLIFVIFPLLIMLLYAFTSNTQGFFNIQFTVANFETFFNTELYQYLLYDSLKIAFQSTGVCLLICYPLAYIVANMKKRTQTILVLLLTATMWINSLILMHAMANVFLIAGTWVVGEGASFPEKAIFLGHDYSIITGMIFLYLPYMFLPIYTQMTKIDKTLIEGASDLGANKFQIIVRVVFPLTLSSVIASCLIVLLPATSTLIVPQIMAYGNRRMIGNLIEYQGLAGNFGQMAALALILAIVLLLVAFLLKRLNVYEEVIAHD